MSMVTLSEMTGLNYQRLSRMLGGAVLMRMDDIGLLARAIPEAFDSVAGHYDPRERFAASGPSRLSRIFSAARPLAAPPSESLSPARSLQIDSQGSNSESG